MYNTNRAYSVAPELRCVPPYKSPHPFDFSSTHSTHLHPLALRPLAIFITSKSNYRENVSQRWSSVFAHFSRLGLTNYRPSTDASTKPAAISNLFRLVCK